MTRLVLHFGLIALAPLPAATRQPQPTSAVTLQNNTLPGWQTTHDLVVTVRRTAPRGKSVETLTYEQRGQVVHCNVALPAGKILCYQMFTEQPARVLALYHDQKQIKPAPPADRFSLPRGTTILTSEPRTIRKSRFAFPRDDLVRSVLYESLLDFADWPPKKIDPDHRWERIIETNGFTGRQAIRFAGLVKLDRQTVAKLHLKVEGRFTGLLERDFVFHTAESTIHWNRLDRSLQRLQATARYDRRRPEGVEEYDLRIELRHAEKTQLSDAEQEVVKQQMTAFSQALSALNAGQARDAAAACRDFRNTWPNAVWRPAVEELARRVASPTGQDRMSTAQLKEAVTRSFVAYEAARTERDYDTMERTAGLMRTIVRDYGVTLGKLLREKDEMVRANAAFALAFGDSPQNLRDTHKAATDASVKVRIAALTGWAAACNRQVNAEVLLAALDDAEAGVRRRALQAVSACVTREDMLVVRLVEKVDHLMVQDKVDGVRADAVEALAAIGAPADIPRLEQALKHELNTSIRSKIEQAIETLRKRR